jgi:lysozyme
MTISEKGLNLIKSEEGCRLSPYLDSASIPTIAWGNTRYADGRKVQLSDPPISQDMADSLLRLKVNEFAAEVDSLIVDSVNQNQFDALVSCTYNIGIGALRESTLRKRVNANPNDPAIRNAFAMWNKIHVDGNLVESKTLTSRRKREADLYFS